MDQSFAKNSYFISFEGIEGSGKSTQINMLKSMLEKDGYRVTLLREPGGTEFGEKLRSAILESKESIAPISEALLFASSRAQLLREKIIPKLTSEKHIVLVDRYIDSSFAYQGKARGLGFEAIEKIHSFYPLNILPHMTIYLKIELKTSFERQSKRGNEKDYFEKEKESFYEKLISGFDECANKFDQRIKTIDASLDQETVFKAIKIQINGLIKNG